MTQQLPHPTHLPPSDLGTRAYWDSAYTTERANFAQNTDDEGTVWFSDAGAEERMCQFLEDLAEEGELVKGSSTSTSGEVEGRDGDGDKKIPARFLDLGTGNGHLLFSLREEGWMGELIGIDYSAQSITLANEILARKPASARIAIAFHEFDILSSTSDAPGWIASGFDVVLDKGTFDAISLSSETDSSGRRICEGYREKVEKLVKKKGRFLITSCNWTEEELRGWFEVDGGELVFENKVQYPSFRFGGREGSSVCTLCFRRG